MTPHRPACSRFIAILVGLATTGCGTLNYTPTELIQHHGYGAPETETELRFAVRVAPEFLEVVVLNSGSDTVALDWGRSWFVTSAGALHGLVPAEAVAELEAATRHQLWHHPTARPEYDAAVQLIYRSGLTDEPQLEWPRPWVSRVPPGAVRTALMVPLEHVRLAAGEPVTIEPLFCTPPESPQTHRFALRIPVQAGSSRDVITLALRTGATHH